MRDAEREGTRLARAGTRQNHQRPRGDQRRRALLVIEPGEDTAFFTSPRRGEVGFRALACGTRVRGLLP